MKQKQRFDKKRILISAAVLAVCAAAFAVAVWLANRPTDEEYNRNYRIDYELVRVTQVLFDDYTVDDSSEQIIRGSQTLNVVILTGPYKGDVVTVGNYMGPMHAKLAEAGTVMTATITTTMGEGYQLSLVNYDYTWLLVGILAVFVAAVAIVGRRKGVLSLVGLAVTIAAVVFVFIPLWLKGLPAIPLTLGICVFVTIACLTLLDGISRKSASAMLGTVLGVLVAGLFAWICTAISGISGLNMEEAEWLLDEARSNEMVLNVRGLFISGILIAALGAVMDVSMGIASAVTELAEVNPALTSRQLFRSGMNIGRDMIGTMTNTLILAFAGSSLNLMIVMFAAGMQPYQFINNDDVMMEIIRSVAGSLGLVLTVPLTALVSSVFVKSGRTAVPSEPAPQNKL